MKKNLLHNGQENRGPLDKKQLKDQKIKKDKVKQCLLILS
jgi:hypothetical protein